MDPKYEANVDKTLTPRKIFIRQILVSSSVWSSFFMFGLCMGTPTIYISQTREEANSTDVISNEMSSWISSAYNYSAIPNLFIVAFLSRKFGRKKTFLVASLTSAVGFVTLYLSSDSTQVIISEVLQGTLIASDGMICVMVLTEYTSPKYRGFFLTFKSATFGWGMLVANTMGTFLHWKSIPVLGFILSVYAFISCLFWPESPYWLASRQNYDACAKSHCWLKGTDEESMKEINSLIMQHKDLSRAKIESSQNILKKIQIAITAKAFYKPFGYTMLMLLLYYFSGKMSCNVYALQLIKNVTNSESAAYTGMLVIDALTVFSMYFTSAIVKFYKRKMLFITTSLFGILFLLCISIYLYLSKLEFYETNSYIFLVLLTLYMIVISCGPITITPSIIAELCPLRYRGLYMLFMELVDNIIMGTVVKILPFLLSTIGAHGAFFFYGSSSLILTLLIYYFIPETKDKTIIEMGVLMGT
ncbi:facilitated trehalose transporter Tret1-like [Pieris napi]|uniref:facilitated trehalose transporter Tret1-like n=1 Tax=Pieris napi TaxID=78633 RepID=UPI001FBC0D88|nr:facilitated trehalose transporter Tret1-like [Pieris napi]XP_047518079.1 facilitated trehalose transporter Tret1-like [Pieris napi]